MELKFLKDEKDSAIVRLENSAATLGIALNDELWLTKGVDVASINKRHPLVGKPDVMVQGKDARKLLETAAKNLKKKVEEFEKAVLKEL